MSFSTPILYLTFNRPKETGITFNQFRVLKPSILYIAQDGPRNLNERKETKAVTDIIQNIDWECDVKYLIREKNLGCKNAVNEALDWFFENEEMGIIMEDDIVADSSFFPFCSELLERYKDDQRIMLISGNNQLGEYPGEDDYFFSKIGAIWGWATWRRAWQNHDKSLKNWPLIRNNQIAKQILPSDQWMERVKNMDKVYAGEIDTWDYQFTMTRLINSGLSILPRGNMIQNIGFNDLATHTKSKPTEISNEICVQNSCKIKHPVIISADITFDKLIFNTRNKKINVFQKIKQKFNEQA